MRKQLRVCVEARDVFASRAVRQSEGDVIDLFEELQVAVTVDQSILQAGVVDSADMDAYLAGSLVVDGCLRASPEARDALAGVVRTRFAGIGSPPNW